MRTDSSSTKVKMMANVAVKPGCFDKYESFELSQAATLSNGSKRFEIDRTYTLCAARADDWVVQGWCQYVY